MFPRPELAVALAGLERRDRTPWSAGPRAAIEWAAEVGFRAVQLDATAPGIRPRELDRSGRRDLAALLRRSALTPAGLDLWIPPEHLADPARAERALDAILQALDLASDLSRLTISPALAVSLILPPDLPADLIATLADASARTGIRVADHAPARPAGSDVPSHFPALGLDPAALLLAGQDPAAAAARAGARLVSARLSDADSVGRMIPGAPGGRLDITAYLASLGVAGYMRALILDLRGLPDQDAAARTVRADW